MLHGTNFDALDVHFDKLCLVSDANVERLQIRNNKICKNSAAMPEGDNHLF
jgi:hypothetical protein